MRIIYSWGRAQEELRRDEEAEINHWVNAGYEITQVRDKEELGITGPWLPPQTLEKLYHAKDERLLRLYDKVEKLAQTHDVLICNYGNVYHPRFLESLKNIYKVIVSPNDPEGSNRQSRPYVHAFDHSFAWGIKFDNHSRITEKFLEWGAKRADWWPCGVWQNRYDHSLTEEAIYNRERDIDLVYVGVPWIKLKRIMEIKRAVPQMALYGWGWGPRVFLGSVVSFHRACGRWDRDMLRAGIEALLRGFWRVRPLPPGEIVGLYQRCKIGINMHLSFGASNMRIYELPANGVMQICDCPEELGEIFEVGKEVVGYHSTEEAIDLIRYYLEHDNERKEIAAAGFRRVMKDYKRLTTFCNAMEKVKRGMVEEGIKFFKDGTAIEVRNVAEK